LVNQINRALLSQKTISDQLNEHLNNMVSELVQETTGKGFLSSGASVSGFQVSQSPNQGEVTSLRYWLANVEDREGGGKGRKSGKGAPFTPVNIMLEWIIKKGITPDDPKTTLKQLAFLFNRRLKEKGNMVFAGEKEGVRVQPIFKRTADNIQKGLADEGIYDVANYIDDLFKQMKS
jgi:hypothetical protein